MHPKNFNPLLPQSSRDYDGDKYSKKSAGSLSTVTKLILCVIFLLILKSSWSYYKADDSILTFPSNVSDSKIIDPSLLSVDTINNQNLPTKDIPKESQDQKQKSNEPDLPKVALGPTANSEQSKDPKIAIGPDIPSTNPTPDDVDKTPSEGTVNSERLEAVMKATLHSFSSYRKYAWGFDELKPVSKTGFDTGYKMGLTIIDSLDTLYIMGKNNPEIHKEFKLARDWVNEKLLFDHGEVNLFETTIRVLGGLLATYHLTKDDMFLNKAKLLGDKLLPGFDTNSGIPFASVDFEKGKGVEAVGMEGSSTSEVTTLGLEFMYLSILTNDKKYKDKIDIIQARISKIEPESCLVPIYISPKTGNYVGSTIRLGSRADSYYEYLFKVSLFAKDNQYFEMWQRSWTSIKTWLFVKSPTQGYWFPGEMDDGVPNWVSTTIKELLGKDPGIEYRKKRLEKMESRPDLSPKMDHLVCFLPGTVLLSITKGKTLASFRKLNVLEQEDLLYATKLMETCIAMYSTTATKLASEIVMFKTSKETEDQQDMWIKSGDTHNLLRPETVESLFYFWRITREEKYRDTAFMIFQAFEKYSRREAGYTNLIDVTNVDGDAKDKMESFWLGETLKYFYLIFSDKEEYPLNEYVFNTEAHAFPINH